MFIMKEVGIKEEIPSMHELDATSFGDLNWETLVDEVRKILSLHLDLPKKFRYDLCLNYKLLFN